MERAVAVKKLAKLLGKSLGYRVNDKAPTAEERVAAKLELVGATAAQSDTERRMQERRRAILAADSEYQAIQAAYKEAKQRADKLASLQHSYKFTVGTSSGMFFHVKAQGDSWEEVIRKVSDAQQKRTRVA